MLSAHEIPSWEPISGLDGSEVFFEDKQDDRGNFYYRKLIVNKSHKIRFEGRDPVHALKPTGKWLHEDDFSMEWVCNPKRRCHSNIAIVVFDDGVIDRLKDVYHREKRCWLDT